MKKRVPGLDLLRGLCAVAVALYHIFFSLNGPTFLNHSLYAVYAFFVISGASLYIAYSDRLNGPGELLSYFSNRLLRLLPLYLLVTLLWFSLSPWGPPRPRDVFLNGTLLFGLGNPGMTSTVTGGWSLGIEFQFYLFFPVLAALARSKLWLYFAALFFVAQRIFIERTLQTGSLAEAWIVYTQGLSFIAYFFAGCCIGRLVKDSRRKPHPAAWALVAGACLILTFLAGPNEASSLKGVMGCVLTLVTCFVVWPSAYLPISKTFRPAADFLGRISYGLYLFHPLVFALLRPRLSEMGIYAFAAMAFAVSMIVAWISAEFFETPVREHGRKWLGSKAVLPR